MIRLRNVFIAGFRGVLNSVQIDLGKEFKSIAVFGDNGSGKSSITDAVEWFYTDRVGHLWKENCKESSLRHVLLPESAKSEVGFKFSEAILDGRKTYSSSFVGEFSNKGPELQQYLADIQKGQERLILRNSDLLDFVFSTKTEKRQYLAKIMGFEALDEFRETLSRTQKKLEETPDYVAAKRNAPEYQREIFKLAKANITDPKSLFSAMTRLTAEAGTPCTIEGDESYKDSISELSKKVRDTDKAEKQSALQNSKQKCLSLQAKARETGKAVGNFVDEYQSLLKAEDEIRQIKLEGFLVQGRKIVDEGFTTPDFCPLCLQHQQWATLKSDLTARIEKLQAGKIKYQNAISFKTLAQSALKELARACSEVASAAEKAQTPAKLLSEVGAWSKLATALDSEIEQSFPLYRQVIDTIETVSPLLIGELDTEVERLDAGIQTLQLSAEEQKILDLIGVLGLLRTAYLKHSGAAATIASFEAQINSVSVIRERFNALHASTLQSAVNTISEEIKSFYLFMHPQEQVDNIKLSVLAEGIEFEYTFHGQLVYPPRKFLSESHLSSLGIAVFFAAARAFNKRNGFIVLDDVVTSFDSGHRLRLLRILNESFSKWQIILLTHEPFWFELIKKEMPSERWMFSELEPQQGFRTQIKASTRTLKEAIILNRQSGTVSANDLRVAIERSLKDVCSALDVKVVFRYNTQNERRMAGELLGSLRGTLKKHSAAMLEKPELKRLEVCGLITNTGSHDSGPVISAGDLLTAADDFVAFDKLLFCTDCETYVSLEKLSVKDARIYCKCGKMGIDWKQ
jgi:ABC-type cobalamin/Fe3+-siderophores transport system ATPase subunit